jgi:N4-gp56 family major capsid protein
MVEFELRDQPLARAVADKRPAKQAMPGDTIVLQRYEDLSLASTALTETTPNTPVEIGTPIKKTITLQEFGNSALVTRKLQLTSLADVDSDIAILLANNQADSIDAVAMAQLIGGSNVIYSGSGNAAKNDIATGDTITSSNIRKAVAKLRGNKAAGRRGAQYWGGIHPDVSADLREESDLAGWRAPHSYADPSNIYAGEIGTYEGVFWVESPRMTVSDNASDVAVYNTIICGRQALAEAVAEEPHTVIGTVTDPLKRYRPIGWYGVLGFARYREEALYRIESASDFA